MSQETTQLCNTETLACEAKPEASLPKVTPRQQIKQQESGYEVLIELPGVAKGDVALKLEKRVLSLQAERRLEVAQETRVLARSLSDCRFELRLKLGEDIDEQALQAKLENGLLRLELPLASEAQAREIAVN